MRHNHQQKKINKNKRNENETKNLGHLEIDFLFSVIYQNRENFFFGSLEIQVN